MQYNGTSVLDRPEVTQVSPVVGRQNWVDSGDEPLYPLTLRIEFPMSARLMTAALYRDGAFLRPMDIATADELWRNVACALLEMGRDGLADYADDLDKDIKRRKVERPDWLAIVHARVAEVTGGAR